MQTCEIVWMLWLRGFANGTRLSQLPLRSGLPSTTTPTPKEARSHLRCLREAATDRPPVDSQPQGGRCLQERHRGQGCETMTCGRSRATMVAADGDQGYIPAAADPLYWFIERTATAMPAPSHAAIVHEPP